LWWCDGRRLCCCCWCWRWRHFRKELICVRNGGGEDAESMNVVGWGWGMMWMMWMWWRWCDDDDDDVIGWRRGRGILVWVNRRASHLGGSIRNSTDKNFRVSIHEWVTPNKLLKVLWAGEGQKSRQKCPTNLIILKIIGLKFNYKKIKNFFNIVYWVGLIESVIGNWIGIMPSDCLDSFAVVSLLFWPQTGKSTCRKWHILPCPCSSGHWPVRQHTRWMFCPSAELIKFL
jgi:hypothetical protein